MLRAQTTTAMETLLASLALQQAQTATTARTAMGLFLGGKTLSLEFYSVTKGPAEFFFF